LLKRIISNSHPFGMTRSTKSPDDLTIKRTHRVFDRPIGRGAFGRQLTSYREIQHQFFMLVWRVGQAWVQSQA